MEDVRAKGEWQDEDGNHVIIVPFFSHLYVDDASQALSAAYSLGAPPRRIGGLGETELETAADSIIRVCHLVRNVVGFDQEDLLNIGKSSYFSTRCLFGKTWDYGSLTQRKYLRPKKVAGINVLFPAKKLIESNVCQ